MYGIGSRPKEEPYAWYVRANAAAVLHSIRQAERRCNGNHNQVMATTIRSCHMPVNQCGVMRMQNATVAATAEPAEMVG